jgi:hypothetical protein
VLGELERKSSLVCSHVERVEQASKAKLRAINYRTLNLVLQTIKSANWYKILAIIMFSIPRKAL